MPKKSEFYAISSHPRVTFDEATIFTDKEKEKHKTLPFVYQWKEIK